MTDSAAETESLTNILFEPWGLGDALIAASVLRERPEQFALACHPRWHPVLRAALVGVERVTLLPIELSYTTRSKRSALTELKSVPNQWRAKKVFSIRGDLRDYVAARRFFPSALVKVSGWSGFAARRIKLLDLPFKSGLIQVRNRYQAWAELVGVPLSQVHSRYAQMSAQGGGTLKNVAIHIGAQWRSRQFPHVARLKESLEAAGFRITILAGPDDRVPEGLSELDLLRTQNMDLVNELKKHSCVITNDSGPMHLSAFLGCPTIALSRISNIEEWLPPSVRAVESPLSPKGYQPDAYYNSDEIVLGWPEVEGIMSAVLELTNSSDRL